MQKKTAFKRVLSLSASLFTYANCILLSSRSGLEKAFSRFVIDVGEEMHETEKCIRTALGDHSILFSFHKLNESMTI
jgi:hypothetical protein